MLTTKLFESAEELLDFVNRGNVLRKDVVNIEWFYEFPQREYCLWFWDDHVKPPKPPKPPKLPKPPKPPKPKGRPQKSKRGPAYPRKEQAKPCLYNEAILCNTKADCTGCGWKPKTKDVLPDRETTLEENT